MKDIIVKLLSLVPSVEKVIAIAPFFLGVLIGYVLRTPISWMLDIIRLVIKL